LNDVVAVLILDAFEDVPIELPDKGNLLVNLDLLQRLLNNPAPIHLKGQRQDLPSHLRGKNVPLLLGACTTTKQQGQSEPKKKNNTK